jgi:hypothetical protein
MNQNCRIKLEHSLTDCMMALSEGNPGALSVCTSLFKNNPQIDPDGGLGGFGPLLNLDSLAIYGSRIWMLHKDVCGSDLGFTLAALRGWQLGLVTEAVLNHAIDNRGDGFDPVDCFAKVQERLPNFGVIEEEEEEEENAEE